jgi:threonine dehydrogenase-like Zn-dependent dehydrogenase
MLALQFSPTPLRYVAGRLHPRASNSQLSLSELRPPLLPTEEWVIVRPRLSGICGSDHAMLDGRGSLYLASLTSTPFVPGHEIVGSAGRGADRRRVVVEPALGCAARGVEPVCVECQAGHAGLCRFVVRGAIAAGLQTGYCSETGGGWSEVLVAHPSQLRELPDEIADEDAVMTEPMACALHGVQRATLEGAPTVGVIGAGTMGLLTIAALRERHPAAEILVAAKHRGQAQQARRLGASQICAPDDFVSAAARMTGAPRLVGHGRRELLLGGLDAVLDCVGGADTLQAAIAATRPRGTVVMLGMPARVDVDLAPAWQQEISIRGAYGYAGEFAAGLELAGRLQLSRLLAEAWPLHNYKRALELSHEAARAGAVKTVFDLEAA